MSFNEQENGKMSAAGKSGTIWGGGGNSRRLFVILFFSGGMFSLSMAPRGSNGDVGA